MNELFRTFLIIIAAAAVLGLVGAALLYRRLRRLNIPPDASFRETLQRVPFSLVLVLDLLDLGFDFLGAPVVWWWLGRLNLQALRKVSLIEALIPGTQLIPTLSACWLAVRMFSPAMQISHTPNDERPTQ